MDDKKERGCSLRRLGDSSAFIFLPAYVQVSHSCFLSFFYLFGLFGFWVVMNIFETSFIGCGFLPRTEYVLYPPVLLGVKTNCIILYENIYSFFISGYINNRRVDNAQVFLNFIFSFWIIVLENEMYRIFRDFTINRYLSGPGRGRANWHKGDYLI